VVSTSVVALTEGVLGTMFHLRLKAGAALTLAVVALAWISAALGAGGSGHPVEKQPATRPVATPPPTQRVPLPGAERPGQTVLAKGFVVDPDGRPVPGAVVRLIILGGWSGSPDLRTTSDPSGWFELSLPGEASGRLAEVAAGTPRVIATAAGFGLGWADPRPGKRTDVQLAADLPIEGRIVDAQGRPIAGVKVKTHNAWASPEENLASFIEDVKSHGWSPWEGPRALKLVTFETAATTDVDGRFRLEGIGRERVVALALSGPTIVTEEVYAMTRTGPAARPVGWEGREPGARSYRGARFEHTAAPCLPIVGTARDVETGRPIAGVKIRGDVESVGGQTDHPGTSTTTDDQGRYVLTGLPLGGHIRLSASSTRGLAYVGRNVSMVIGSATGKPARCDIGLRKGIVIRGRVTDQVTGKPVRAGVTYYPFPDATHLEGYPTTEQYNASGDDGWFEIAVPPGRGVIAARSGDPRYLLAVGAERIEGLNRIPPLARMPPHPAPDYQVVVEVNPTAGSGPAIRDLPLVPARTVKGMVVGPDGKPAVDAVAIGLDANVSWGSQVLASGDFAVEDLDPRASRRISFFHVDRRLAGSVRIEGDEAGPLSVPLQPWGVVIGRIVDERGRPQSGLVLTGSYPNRSERDSGILPRRAIVGDDGRFRFEGLVPGLQYSASVLEDGIYGYRRAFRGLRVGPGETRDLGDIKLERYDPAKD
jgi:hypothetical protein